jgi:hypothetical protein
MSNVPFPLNHPRVLEIQESLRAALSGLGVNGADGRICAVKDPRLSRLLPVWLPVLRALGAEPALMMALREPADLVAEMDEQDCLGPSTARLLWLRHVAEPLAFALGHELQVAIVPYWAPESVVADRLRRIGVELDTASSDDEAFLRVEPATPPEGPLAQMCDRLYQAIVAMPVFAHDTVPPDVAEMVWAARDLKLDGHLDRLYREAMGVSSQQQRLTNLQQRLHGQEQALAQSRREVLRLFRR